MSMQEDRRTGPPPVGGHEFGEVASALQKCVRRGMEDDALHWATLLDRHGCGEFAMKRCRIMAMEDVGVADPNVIVQVQALYETWTDLRKRKDDRHEPWRLALVMAVMVLCRAAKSRATDHALMAHYLTDERREIPDWALDGHTRRGAREKRRGMAYFWRESTRLLNAETGELEYEPVIPDPYRARAIEATGGGR